MNAREVEQNYFYLVFSLFLKYFFNLKFFLSLWSLSQVHSSLVLLLFNVFSIPFLVHVMFPAPITYQILEISPKNSRLFLFFDDKKSNFSLNAVNWFGFTKMKTDFLFLLPLFFVTIFAWNVTTLSQPRYVLVATKVGDLAFFAGGYAEEVSDKL